MKQTKQTNTSTSTMKKKRKREERKRKEKGKKKERKRKEKGKKPRLAIFEVMLLQWIFQHQSAPTQQTMRVIILF
jgi:hypothetical protein